MKTRLPKPFVVFITGAGKGLGYHMALAYAQAGATGIIISSRTASDLEALSTEMQKINPSLQILSRVCDTTSDPDLENLAKDVEAKFGRLDVCIANAGIISKYVPDSTMEHGHRLPNNIIEDKDFARVTDINYVGSQKTAQHFLPLLIKTKDGPQAYIVITSLAAHSTASAITPAAYNVSKVANCRFVEHVQADHGKEGVLAYALHPGTVLTPQTQYHTGEIWADGKADAVS